jgi:predicted oxidoreductase
MCRGGKNMEFITWRDGEFRGLTEGAEKYGCEPTQLKRMIVFVTGADIVDGVWSSDGTVMLPGEGKTIVSPKGFLVAVECVAGYTSSLIAISPLPTRRNEYSKYLLKPTLSGTVVRPLFGFPTDGSSNYFD